MAKKPEPEMENPLAAKILREEPGWGVRLILRPFSDPRQNTAMEISAEIDKPKPGRRPDIKIWWLGVPVQKPMSLTDSVIWSRALTTIQEEAKKVADGLKPAKAKKKA